MDLEIEESERNAEEVVVVVEKDGKEVEKTIKASFKTASQLARHTRSDKVFHSLYDDERPIALAQFGSTWVQPHKDTWTFTTDGPRVNILGLYKNYEEATRKGSRMVKMIHKHGYKSYPMQAYPARNWIVMRRGHPQSVPDDEVLCTNILNYARRRIRLEEADFAEEIRQKTRPEVKPPTRPNTLGDMYPKAMAPLEAQTKSLSKTTKMALKCLEKDTSLTHRQRVKARTKLKKMQRKKLKSMVAHIPQKSRDSTQKFAALAWLTSPRYERVDDTKYFGYQAPENSDDPAPDMIYAETDFDEAMIVCILRTFPTEEECLEFIDNKAKHDLEFCDVVCMLMYEHSPMDAVITNAFKANVSRGYLTEIQQKVIVDRENRTKSALQHAKENPDVVSELTTENGQTVLKESKATQKIREELEAEKTKTDKIFEESVAEAKAKKAKQLEDVKKEEEEVTEVTEDQEVTELATTLEDALVLEEEEEEEEEGGGGEKK
jgi:hypothetical protein